MYRVTKFQLNHGEGLSCAGHYNILHLTRPRIFQLRRCLRTPPVFIIKSTNAVLCAHVYLQTILISF